MLGGAVKIVLALGAACGLTFAACATANTPAQDLAYERWGRCASAYVQLQHVDVSGRITFQFSSAADRRDVLQCLDDAGRAGPALPGAVGVRPPGGP
jgi:hypothetical protein